MKTITMEKLMKGLGIAKNDIVLVDKQALRCNEKFDLVKVDGTYSSTIPNLIVGMVSGKFDYCVYKLESVEMTIGENNGKETKN